MTADNGAYVKPTTHIITYRIHCDDQGRPDAADMEIGPVIITHFLDETPPAWMKRMHNAVVQSLRSEWHTTHDEPRLQPPAVQDQPPHLSHP